jgi:hypothetical protein
MYRTRYSYQIVIQLEFCIQIFAKYSNTKFHENPCNESWLVSCSRLAEGDRDRHDEAKSRFSKFCERSKNGTLGNRLWGRHLVWYRSRSSESSQAPSCHVNGPEFCDQLSDSPVVRRHLQQSVTKLHSWPQYDCCSTHSSSLCWEFIVEQSYLYYLWSIRGSILSLEFRFFE